MGCPFAYSGFSATFHDTSLDAYKNVEVYLTGADAEDMLDNDGGPIRLPRPRHSVEDRPNESDPADNAVWSPASGLFVGTPSSCFVHVRVRARRSNMFDQPCTEYEGGTNPDQPGDPAYFKITFRLPAG